MKQTHYQRQRIAFDRADAAQLVDDLRHVLSTPEGRRLLIALQEHTAIYTPMGLDHLEYQAGIRNMGLNLLAKCNDASRENVALANAERNALIMERNEALKAAAEKDRTTNGR